MRLTADIAPPNSLLLIMDRSVGRIPESMAGGPVAHTRSCVAIGTRSGQDGTTHVTLECGSRHAARETPVFDGVLHTPDRRVAVCSVLDDVILEVEVATDRTRVLILANDYTEPDEIRILVSADGP